MHSQPYRHGVVAVLLLAARFAIAQESSVTKTDPASAATNSSAVENSVVKVFSTVRYPDLYKPWTKQSPSEVTGSGVVIERKRILSNAHVVLYSSQVQVQANQSGDKVPAAVASDKMIGLAFSRLGDSDNIGYIIPCEEIELFLQDVADGTYDGKPAIFDDFQTLENPALRAFLKLNSSAEGMIVHEPDSPDP